MNTNATNNVQAYGRVVVLMGGSSAEREVSLMSGQAVLQALQSAGVDAHGMDAAVDDLHEKLVSGNFARAFIALHGRGGEDGVIQGMLETIGMPYTGSRVLGSALGMDKLRTKRVWQGAGIRTPDFAALTDAAGVNAVREILQYPLIIKPAHEGSSIGISKVESADRLLDAWQQASRFDDTVLAEQWIEGPEFTAGILGDEVLPLIRLETPNTFYDYEAKYEANTTRYLIPCGLEEDQEASLQDEALKAFRAVGASGWGRVDFMLDASGKPWFIEVNTVPGLTDHSLVPMAAKAAGTDFSELACRILDSSLDQAAVAAQEDGHAKA